DAAEPVPADGEYVVRVEAAALNHLDLCRGAPEAIATVKRDGQRLWRETCPQYLAFTADVILRPGLQEATYVVTLALRPTAHQEAIWQALRDGTLSVVSTDQCPYLTRWKAAAGDFVSIANAPPGVKNRLKAMWELGGRAGGSTRHGWLMFSAPR